MSVNTRQERVEFIGVDKISSATSSAKKGVGELKDAVESVKNALAVLGVTVGVGAMVQLQLDTMRATAALDDMAERTGATVERLSAMQRVAKVGGHDFEGLTDQMGRMIKGLKSADDDGQKASQALAYLGIKAKELGGQFRDPALIIEELAAKLAQYRDSGNKAALVQDALGKGAERYLPFLKDLAERTDYFATVTAKQAAEAEVAEKNINRLKLQFEDARRELVLRLTPAVIEFTEKLLLAKQTSGNWATAGLLTGFNLSNDDLDKRIRELDVTLERIGKNQNRRMQGMDQGFWSQMLQGVSGTNESLLLSERQFLERLRKQRADAGAKDPNSPLFEFGGDQSLKDLDYQSRDDRRLKPDQIAKMQQEGIDELIRQDVEMTKYLGDRELKLRDNINAAIEARKDVNAMVARAMQYGTTDESAENQHPGFAGRADRLQQIRVSFKTEEQIAIESYNTRRSALNEFSDQELQAVGGRQAAERQMEIEHATQLYQIRKNSLDRVGSLTKASWHAQTQTVLGEIVSMTAGVTTHSRRLFEINKIGALANAALKTPEAIMSAYAFGAKFGGPPLGALMAGLAGAAMLAQMQMIQQAQFGGTGGVAPSVGGTPAPPVTPVGPSGSTSSAPSQVVVNVNVQGNIHGNQQFVDDVLIPGIRDAVDNRDFILIGSDSRQAQTITGS